MPVQHKVVYRFFMGGDQRTTLCGRAKLSNEGMNVVEKDSEVSCKFCLRELKRLAKRKKAKQ